MSLPYLFKTPIGVDLLLRIFKKDSSFTTINQSAKIHYQINSKNKIYAGIIATASNNALKIFQLNNKNSLFFRGYGSSLITDTYFENELLRFGGINSIRGFEENSLFASLFGVLTKAGLLRFNYANGKNEDIRFKLANSKIHISLTTNF